MLVVGACGGSVSHQDPIGDVNRGGSTADGTSVEPTEPDQPVVITPGSGGRGGQVSIPPMRAHAGEGGAWGGDGNSVPPHQPICGEGGAVSRNCSDSIDVVCSWQRVTVWDEAWEETGGQPALDACAAGARRIDRTDAPQGGAGGDYPDRNACSGYHANPIQFEPGGCRAVTYEQRGQQCNIDGHCCVVVHVRYCGP